MVRELACCPTGDAVQDMQRLCCIFVPAQGRSTCNIPLAYLPGPGYDVQHKGCITSGPVPRGPLHMTAKTQPTTPAVASTDRIEKRVELRAPRARVWRAIADASQFAAWFNVKLDGAFAEGATTRGQITSKGYEH